MKKVILVIDGQGGNIGAQLIKMLRQRFSEIEIYAVGTNSIATSNMIKSEPDIAATGENAVIVGARKADIIVGPIGIAIADSLMGETTANMANAVGQSRATRILIPMNKCDTLIAGIDKNPISTVLQDAVEKIATVL